LSDICQALSHSKLFEWHIGNSQSCLCRQASPLLQYFAGSVASAEFPAFAGKTTEFKRLNKLWSGFLLHGVAMSSWIFLRQIELGSSNEEVLASVVGAHHWSPFGKIITQISQITQIFTDWWKVMYLVWIHLIPLEISTSCSNRTTKLISGTSC